MAKQSSTNGLVLRGKIWHIRKTFLGERIQESTGTSDREEAEHFLIHLLERKRQEKVYGVRHIKTFREAATKYLEECTDRNQPSLHLTATYLAYADPFIGDLPLTHVDNDTLEPLVEWIKSGAGHTPTGRKRKPCKNRTVNIALQRIIRVLNKAHRSYKDAQRRPWLDVVPEIDLLDENEKKRPPYPMDWDEQRILFKELPPHLQRMALFKVNTGCREQEVVKLRWEWEVAVPELNTSVFIVPPNFGGRSENAGVKNREERVIVLNDVARAVVEEQRKLLDDEKHEGKEWVFPYQGRALHRMNDSAWDSATKRAALKYKEEFGKNPHPLYATLRIHDLKHTFGRRLTAAGVSREQRQILLGHTNGDVTSHYSAQELQHLIDAANRVAQTTTSTPTLVLLRRRA